jgi:hypothetical protein
LLLTNKLHQKFDFGSVVIDTLGVRILLPLTPSRISGVEPILTYTDVGFTG